MFNNKIIKFFIGSWNIFKLGIYNQKKGHDKKRLGTNDLDTVYLVLATQLSL